MSSGEQIHVRVMVRVRPFSKRELAIFQQQQQQQPYPLHNLHLQKSDTSSSKDGFASLSISGRESPQQLQLHRSPSLASQSALNNLSFGRTATPVPVVPSSLQSTFANALGVSTSSGAGELVTSPGIQNCYPPAVVCPGDRETVHFLEPERDWAEREAFRFDKVFWSLPVEQWVPPPGASNALFCPPSRPHTQQDVFDEVGRPAVDSAMKGIHVTILAYGQTGSGKTHSMLGSASDPGVAPLFVRELFRSLKEKQAELGDDKYDANVALHFFEVYNEKIRDLLTISGSASSSSSSSSAPNTSPPPLVPFSPVTENSYSVCKVRQFPDKGTFVEGLRRQAIADADECLRAINAGMSQRAVASTAMNATSSRSHGIFQLVVTQRFAGVTRTSLVNLVDLAGSERVKQSQVTGLALTEAAMINKSLSTLRRVIDVLIDNSTLKKGKAPSIPPFRESILTWVLSDSLGGNSKTVMIAAVSPSHANSDDTLSTLRYALKAKAIVCTAKVNEEKTSAILSSLKDEIDRLKQQLSENSSGSVAEELASKQQEMEDMAERAKKLEARHGAMEEEMERRRAEIEAAQAQIQELDHVEDRKRVEEEALMRFRQDLVASEQALFAESASRQRAEEELVRATQQRHEAEELRKRTEREIHSAKREAKEMRVRQLLSTFQSAFVRMMKGQDLDHLRQERAKSLQHLDEATRKVSLSDEQLDVLREQKNQADKHLDDIRAKIDKTVHSDMLSEDPLRDRRVVDVRRKRLAADDELRDALDAFEDSQARLVAVKVEQLVQSTKNRVEKARLVTEIAEIERQLRHLNTRVGQHFQVVDEHERAENLYREKQRKHLEELSFIEANNSHRGTNIAALNEALARERSNGEVLCDVRNRKEREYEVLSGLLEQLETSFVETREESERLKGKMDEIFLPPSARNSMAAVAAFRRSATAANCSVGVHNDNNNNNNNNNNSPSSSPPAAADKFGRCVDSASPATVSMLDRDIASRAVRAEENERGEEGGDEEILFLMERQHNSIKNKNSERVEIHHHHHGHNEQQQSKKVPWRGTSFSRSVTSSSTSTFSSPAQFDRNSPALLLKISAEHGRRGRDGDGGININQNMMLMVTPRQLICGGGLRSGGVHYNPPLASKKRITPLGDQFSCAFERRNTPTQQNNINNNNNSVGSASRNQPAASSSSPSPDRHNHQQNQNQNQSDNFQRETTSSSLPSAGVFQPRRAATPVLTTLSASNTMRRSSLSYSSSAAAASQQKTHHERIRDQLLNSKPIFGSRGESLVASGVLRCVSPLLSSTSGQVIDNSSSSKQLPGCGIQQQQQQPKILRSKKSASDVVGVGDDDRTLNTNQSEDNNDDNLVLTSSTTEDDVTLSILSPQSTVGEGMSSTALCGITTSSPRVERQHQTAHFFHFREGRTTTSSSSNARNGTPINYNYNNNNNNNTNNNNTNSRALMTGGGKNSSSSTSPSMTRPRLGRLRPAFK